MESLSHRITADHGQFIVYNGISGSQPEYESDGLLSQYEGGVVVLTGRSYGPVDVAVELRNSRPGAADAQWSEVSEVGIDVTTGPLAIGELLDGPVAGAHDLAHVGPGSYRMRVSARGRDESRAAGEQPSVLEDFLIQVWREGLRPSETLRTSDRVGKENRGEHAAGPYSSQESEAVKLSYLRLLQSLPAAPSSDASQIVTAAGETPANLQTVQDALRQPSLLVHLLGVGGQPVVNGEWVSFQAGALSLSVVGAIQYLESGLVTTWNWQTLTTPTPTDPFPRFQGLLAEASRLEIGVTESDHGSRVMVRHEGLPQALSGELKVLWDYYLKRLLWYIQHGEFFPHPWV